MTRRFFPEEEIEIIEDDFDAAAQYGKDHHVPPPAPAKYTNSFAELGAGRTLGKRVLAFIDPQDDGTLNNPPFINVLELSGPDAAATNVQLTIVPQRIIQVGGVGQPTLAEAKALVDAQQASGSIDTFTNETVPGSISYTPFITRLDWGIGGLAVKDVDVDIGYGLNVNISCSFLRINVLVDPLLVPIDVEPGGAAIYELGAFVGPGYAKRNNAQRTICVSEGIGLPAGPGGGGSAVVPIPRFATRVSLIMGSGNAFQSPFDIRGWRAQLLFFRSPISGFTPINPAAIPDYIMGVMDVRDGENSCCQFMIPNGAYYMAVVSNFAPAVQQVSLRPYLIFDLGI